MMSILIVLHVLSAVVWVGGMFFAYVVLRPAAAAVIDPPLRMPLWAGAFQRFFLWVWVAIALLLASGYGIIFGIYGGMQSARPFIHVMTGTGILMMLLFMHVYFASFPRMKRAIVVQDWSEAGRNLNQIRRVIAINLVLGLITVAVGTGGPYLV